MNSLASKMYKKLAGGMVNTFNTKLCPFAKFGIKNIYTSNKSGVNNMSLYKNYKKAFFSQKDKSEEEKCEEPEKTRASQEDTEENHLAKEKYKEIKALYNEQQHKMELLKKKFEDLRQAYLNNVEETEQIKIRNDREVSNTKDFAISKFAKDLLDVHDNFSRAMESIADKDIKLLSEEEKIETFNNFLEGIELTKCGLGHALKKHGVHEFDPLKEKFDPHKHEAVFDYEDEELSPGTVGQVLQSGFKIGDRVLRPAKVGVIKKIHKA